MRTLLALSLLALAACLSTAPEPGVPGRVETVRAADGTPIECELAGSGGPTLVFLHGWCGNREQWQAQARSFSTRQRTLAIDLAGHGGSGRARASWSVQELGADVARVLEALSIERAVLVGHSLGASVALEAARLVPERVALLVPVDTWHDLAFRVPEHNLQQALASYRADFEDTCKKFAAQMFGPRAGQALRRRVVADMLQATPEVAIALLEDFLHYDAAAALRSLEIPVVGINSNQRPTKVAENRQVDPDYEVHIIDGVGHYLMLEQPAEFDATLMRVLLRIE